jgi:hypothetical protein
MNSPKPQDWTREYASGLVLRIETDGRGLWQVSGDEARNRQSLLAYSVASMQSRADRIAGVHATGPWRRLCQRCGIVMALESRNRPDSGRNPERSQLWVCSSPSCQHAEPADD